MITWRMAAAWVAALVVATVLTWQIVGLADSQVGETPIAVAPSLSTSSTGGPSTTAATSSTSSTADPTPTTTVATSPTSQTSPTTATTTPSSSSTSSTQSTSTTGSDEAWSLQTITTTGGVLVVRYRTGEVVLQAATPAPGFSVEVDDAGPPRVRVEFESETSDARVDARWDKGILDIDVDD